MMERMSIIKEHYMKLTKAKLDKKLLGKTAGMDTTFGTQMSEQIINENPFANPNESSPPVGRQMGGTHYQKPSR